MLLNLRLLRTFFLALGCLCAGSLVQADDLSPDKVEFFEKQVRPLLIKHCYSCHSTQSGHAEAGLLLDSQSGWVKGGDHGTALIPGDVEASLLIRAIRYEDLNLQMPPDAPLADQDQKTLENWVRMGAPDPRQQPDQQRLTNASDPVAGKSHWAFQPFHSAPIVAYDTTQQVTSSIDSFVLQKLNAAQLHPAPDADKRTLIRRLYFQLIGLPPTPDQVAEFLSDTRPEASAHLVDQLLDSPHFGERWGRHWLDLARYADSNGLDENFLFREAWRYRNWVIDAVNADLPYDEFLTLQIAGDLLPYDSIEQRDQQRIAAGFLVLGPKVLLGNNPDNQRMEIADEQLDTIGKSVLGLTLGCARCHDHKFDPIPTRDYYALAGIMTSTQVMEQRYMLGQQRVMEQLVGLGIEGHRVDDAYEAYWRDRPRLQAQHDQAAEALKLLQEKNGDGLADYAAQHADAVAEIAKISTYQIEQRIDAQLEFVNQLKQKLSAPPPIPPRGMIPSDIGSPHDEHVRVAGQFDKLGESVSRGFLQVLQTGSTDIPEDQSGRLQLAAWLTDVENGAGRLAARVLANRVWHHLIGVGIVRTVDNFGRTGEAPTHPELLDHLAQQLIDSNWSVKSLIRKIVLSRTFQMSSQHNASAHAIDPDNELLWRAHRRRLDPESLRDAMLTAASAIDLKPMDSTVWYLGDQATAVGSNDNRRRTDFPCRSVYLPVVRNDLPELFEVFDFANPHATTGLRPQTMVATQGLFLLNDESVMTAAEKTAKKVIDAIPAASGASRVDAIYELLFSEQPDEQDREELLLFIDGVSGRSAEQGAEDSELRAWSLACHALLASSRFQILE